MQHIWAIFWQIERRGRSGNGYAALPVPHSEVEAFLRLRGEPMAAWELDLLDQMEGERLGMLNEGGGGVKRDHVSTRPMTTQLFDAMFG